MKLGDWIGFLCLIIALRILWEFRQILLLLLTGIVLAIALNSLVRSLQTIAKYHGKTLSRGVAVVISLLCVVFFAFIFLGLVMPPFLAQFEQLLELVPVALDQIIGWVDSVLENPPAWLPLSRLDFEIPSLEQLNQQFGSVVTDWLEGFFAFFKNSFFTMLQVLLVMVFTVMFLVNPQAYRRLLLLLFPSFYRRRADYILEQCEVALLSWMRGILINSLFVATFCGIGLLFIGVRFVLAHAVLAGVFNLVPNIGPATSVVFPLSVALVNSPWKAIAVLILYLIVQNLESYWFSPMVMHKQVSLLPAATLLAQLFFAQFLGFLGLVLALPLAVIAKTWLEEAFVKDILDQWRRPPRRLRRNIDTSPTTSPFLSQSPSPPDSPEADQNQP
ncbi:MAG: AI-2E family transporter [Kamptonema sp. SIO4C4]|nr:AI-2E family transporter [Kamptonema sp. SIO4C4]